MTFSGRAREAGGPAEASVRPSIEALRRRIARLEGGAGGIAGQTGGGAGRMGGGGGQAAGAAAQTAGGAAAERRADDAADDALPLGLAAFDRLFRRGGLCRGALHELAGGEARGGGAAAGFAVALLARAMAGRDGAVLWAADGFAAEEAGGGLYGPGLRQLGLDPARLLVVAAPRPAEMLWALEEGLASGGLLAVVGEVAGRPRALDLTATRRLMLRAREHGVTALLVRHAGPAEPTAAATRIRVAAHPSAPPGAREEDGRPARPGLPAPGPPAPGPPASGLPAPGLPAPGLPTWRLAVEKNRDGPLGAVAVEWDPDARVFREPEPAGAANPRRVAAAPADRPAEILPLRQVS
jgi:protein ImuA